MFDWINMQQNITVFYLIQRPKLFWFGVSQPLEKTHWKYDPKDFWPFRRLFILMRRQDLKKILTTTTTTLETCDIWDTDYNFYKWEPEFVTIFVTWQSRVTLDSIRNSCDVYNHSHPHFLHQIATYNLLKWITSSGVWVIRISGQIRVLPKYLIRILLAPCLNFLQFYAKLIFRP